MAIMQKSTNPVFSSIERSQTYTSAETASYQGITLKTASLILLAVLSGFFTVYYLPVESWMSLLIPALIVAMIAVFVSAFVPRLAMPFGIVYALAEGVVLGVLTVVVNIFVPGAGYTAAIGTATIFVVMLFLYTSRTIRVTSRFRTIMLGILISLLFFFIVFGILGLTTQLFAGANYGILIGVSLFLIIFGALMLALDFDRAETIVTSGADKRYEWVVAIGLMVTIVWIYIEILRLLLILAARRD